MNDAERQTEDLRDMMMETLARNNRVRLSLLPPDERKAQIQLMVDDVEGAADFEMMSYLSENKKEVSTEIRNRISMLEGVKASTGGSILMGTKATPGEIDPFIASAKEAGELQKAGVTIDEDLPAGSLEMGFALNPLKAVQKELSAFFGSQVSVTEKDGEAFYFNPKERKLKLINPTGAGLIGSSMVEAGDIVGTVTGGFLGRKGGVKAQIAAETTGSFVGTGLTEFTRLSIGRFMGVNDLTYLQMAAKAGFTGAKAAAFTGGTGGVVASAKWMKNWFEGGIFDKKSAIDAGAGAEEAEIAVDEINRLLGGRGAKFKGTTGKMSDDLNIQADEAAVREIKEFKQQFSDRDIKNQEAISEALDVVTKPKPKQEGAYKIQKIAAKDVAEKTAIEERKLLSAEAALDKELKNLSSVSSKKVGAPTRETLDAMKVAENKAQVSTWGAMKKKNGFNEEKQLFGINIPKGEGATRLEKIFSRRAETATTVSAKRAASKIFVKGDEVKDAGFILLPDGSKYTLKSEPTKRLQDLNDYNDQLGKISKDIRAIESNPSAGQAAVRDLNEAKAALKADRADALILAGKEGLLKDITAAELKTAKFYEKYSEGVIGELTKKVDGVFKLKDSKFVSRILEGTPDDAIELAEIIAKSPKLVNLWKEGIADVYKSKVFTGKKFNEEAHKRFLQENGEIMAKFIPNMKEIGKSGDLSKVLERQTVKYKEAISRINKDWSGKLQSMDPREVVDFITTRKGGFTANGKEIQHQVSKIQDIKKTLEKDYPAAWKEVQEEYSTKLRNSVQDLKTKQVNSTKLNKVLIENKEELVEMMGQGYYDNLIKVNKVAEIAAKKLKNLPESETIGIINALIRASIAPPLSKEGRGLTALNKWTRKATHKIIADAFLDIKTISKNAKAAAHSRSTREILEIAVSAGMIDTEEE